MEKKVLSWISLQLLVSGTLTKATLNDNGSKPVDCDHEEEDAKDEEVTLMDLKDALPNEKLQLRSEKCL